MAKERTVLKTALQVASSYVEEMECVFYIVKGHLEWSPKYVRYFLRYECRGKNDTETFRKYLERKNDIEFSYVMWSNLAKECGWILEKENNSNTMDISALVRLFECLFSMKESEDHWPMMGKLKKLRNLRNKVMHSLADIMDSSHLEVLGRELHTFIREAGNYYELNNDVIDGLQKKLRIDFEEQFAQGKMQLYQVFVSVVKEGRSAVKKFLRHTCTTENLPFGMGSVNKLDVFHELAVMLRDGSCKVHNYKQIFENPHLFIIVSGVAGSGKSTLLENIAVQQVQAINDASTGVTNYELLLYIQCRDRYSNTLNEVLTQFFPDMCALHGLDVVREALRRLRVIYLIDGFDEYSSGKTVLQDVVGMSWKSNCRVIITTRPHAVNKLHALLSSIKYAEFEVAPLTQLEEQLNFLSKYEPYLRVNQKKGFLESGFKTMKPTLRSLFTEPLKLIRFCKVFVSFPGKISEWETPYDAAEDFFLVYRSLIETKLVPASYRNMNAVIDDIFQVIGLAALVYLNSNTLTFKENSIQQIQRQCLSILRENHNIKDLDMENVLSSILKMKRPISGQGVLTYAFNHKTDQEYFASQYVIRQIQTDYDINQVLLGRKLTPTVGNEAESVSDVQIKIERWPAYMGSHFKTRVATSNPHLRPFLKVLQHVVRDLNANNTSLLKQRWSELSQALQDAGADYRTLLDLVLACPSSALVVKWAAETARDGRDVWGVNTARDLAAVALMLEHAQPNLLSVKMRPRKLEATCWPELVRSWNGDLRLWLGFSYNEWYTGYPNCDRAVAPLLNSRCRLVNFRGHLTTAQGVSAIASVASSESELHIWLRKPLLLDFPNMRCTSIRERMHFNCRIQCFIGSKNLQNI